MTCYAKESDRDRYLELTYCDVIKGGYNQKPKKPMSNTTSLDDSEDTLIPCEFCNEMIRFNDYENHTRMCSIQSTMLSSDYIIYRDEETMDVYRINIAPALMAFQNMGIEGSNAGEAAIDPHSMVLLPQIIPSVPALITPSDTHAFNILLSDMIGTVEVGIPDIDQVLYKQTDFADDVCPICQDSIVEVDHVKTLCKHSYCAACIRQWLSRHTTCPVCNQDQRDLLQQKDKLLCFNQDK